MSSHYMAFMSQILLNVILNQIILHIKKILRFKPKQVKSNIRHFFFFNLYGMDNNMEDMNNTLKSTFHDILYLAIANTDDKAQSFPFFLSCIICEHYYKKNTVCLV